MTRSSQDNPTPKHATDRAAAEHVIIPRVIDIGGIKVRRSLPAKERQMVGPFIFFDEFGPGEFLTGTGMDVRPHPHIGLSTVSYLFDGAIMHRDSLGVEQLIKPGELGLMKSGKAIVHSERTTPEDRARGSRMFGIQTWMALPKDQEESDPAFTHHGAEDLPVIEDEGKRIKVIMGALYGARSAAKPPTETFFAAAHLNAGASLPLDTAYEERAIFISSGALTIDGQAYQGGQLVVLRPGIEVTIKADTDAQMLLLGGAPMDGPRYLWWNFVSSSKDAVMQAAEDWENGRMPIIKSDSDERIPLDGARPKFR